MTVADRCTSCGLDFKQHEQGDAPAVFGIWVIGTSAAIGASAVEIIYEPPYWVHAAIWIPFIVFGSLLALRFGKAMLIATHWRLRKQDFG